VLLAIGILLSCQKAAGPQPPTFACPATDRRKAGGGAVCCSGGS
jgi:hypothetical protein